MLKISAKFGPNVKILIFPLITLAMVSILGLLFVSNGIPLVKEKIAQYNEARKEELSLQEKLNALKVLPLESLNSAESVAVALPNKNPGVWLTSQAKRTGLETEVEITEISVSNVIETENLTSSEFSLELETNDYPKLLDFFKDITVYLPMSFIEKLEVQKRDSNNLSSKIDVKYYWSDFPKTLPPLAQPPDSLTNEDVSFLSEIENFKMPVFIELNPTTPQERLEPFN